MRSAIAAMVAVAVLGCGDELSGAESTQVARQELIATRLALTVIRSPTELATWNWAGRLVPTSAKSAYLVAVPDPRDTSNFLAWGYDVRAGGSALFFVRGKTATYWSQLHNKFLADLAHFQAGGAGFDPGFGWGGATEVYGRPPRGPTPPHGGNDWSGLSTKAWEAAQQIDLQLQGL